MKRTRSGWWLIRPRTLEDTRSLVAALLLVVAGVIVRGPIGLAAAVLFGAIAVVVVNRLMHRETMASLDPDGLTIHQSLRSKNSLRRLWTQVDGVLIWTNQTDDGRMVDVLTVVTGLDETFTTVDLDGAILDDDASARRRPIAVTAERTSSPDVMEHSVPLDGCVVDLFDLRAALVGFGCEAPVIDQRITL